MSITKSIIKGCLPPVITKFLQKLRGSRIRFEGGYATWEEATARCTGYDAELILDKVLDATLKVKQGVAAFERDSVLFDEIVYAWPVTAGLMWAAARNGGRLNVLDFGGALGSSYFQNKKFLQTLNEVHWSVVEQYHYVNAGQLHIQDEILNFYPDIDAAIEANTPNVVLLSSVLQYMQEPDALLAKLMGIGADAIILDRTPYSISGENVLINIQKVPSSIYSASYPCRFFVEGQIIKKFKECGYELVESFESLDRLDNSATWKGHIFYKASNND